MLTAATATSPVVNQTHVEVNGINIYGLDAELYLKKQAKYNVNEEKEALSWIETMIGEKLTKEGDLYDKLKSGIALCKLVNTIRPNLIPKIHEKSIALLERENIGFYLEACKNSFHLASGDLFVISDLYERKDIHQVLTNIYTFARHVSHHQPAEKPRLQRSATSTSQIILPKEEKRPVPTEPPKLKWSEKQKLQTLQRQQQQLQAQQRHLAGEVAITIGEPNSLEDLFLRVSTALKMSPTDERIMSAIVILKNNAYDTRESLIGLQDNDYNQMNIPLRFVKEIQKIIMEEDDNKKVSKNGSSFFGILMSSFACLNPFNWFGFRGFISRSVSSPPTKETIEV